MKIETWNIEALTGYKPKTTFYEDFSIAEAFGIEAMKDTFERCFAEWKNDIEYVTELAMALNWKSWRHSKFDGNEKCLDWYVEQYWELEEWIRTNYEGEELAYYFRTTD